MALSISWDPTRHTVPLLSCITNLLLAQIAVLPLCFSNCVSNTSPVTAVHAVGHRAVCVPIFLPHSFSNQCHGPSFGSQLFKRGTSLPWMLSAQINLQRPFYCYSWGEIILPGVTSQEGKAAEFICAIKIATTASSTVAYYCVAKRQPLLFLSSSSQSG